MYIRNWRILIELRLRCGYHSTEWRCRPPEIFNLAVFNLAINGQIRLIKTTAKLSRYTGIGSTALQVKVFQGILFVIKIYIRGLVILIQQNHAYVYIHTSMPS